MTNPVRRRPPQPRELGFDNFSGGLNLRDAPSELGNNESPDLLNVTLDERGGVQKRLGYEKKNPAPYATSYPPQQLFEWRSRDVVFTQCGGDVFKDDATAPVHTFTTVARCGFSEFGSSVYMIHPVDGLFVSTDGTTWTAVVGGPKGAALEPWQTRLLACGDPSQPARLYASSINDAADWSTAPNRTGTDMSVTNSSTAVTSASAAFTSGDIGKQITIGSGSYRIVATPATTQATLDTAYTGVTAGSVSWSMSGDAWTNDIKEHDSEPLITLAAAAGVDIAGKPGLLAFKQRSFYRVNDPDTGAYQTMDVTVGAASALAVASLLQTTFFICDSGIYRTNGVNPAELVSSKVQPLFQDSQIAFDQLALFCAGAKGDRIHFSLPRYRSTSNDLHLEYHPQQGWITASSDAVSCYLRYTDGAEKLYGGSPTVAGQVYEMGVGGTDDGADITCRYQTKWISPQGGIDVRFRRLRVFGRGEFDLYVKTDFDTGTGDLVEVSLPGGAGSWDSGSWDSSLWAPGNYEDTDDFWSLGRGKAISFLLSETSGLSGSAPQLLQTGVAPEAGSFAVYSLIVQFIPIGV